VDDLSKTLESDKNEKTRIAAAVALGRLGDTRAVLPLARALQRDTSEVVRSVSATALGHLGDPRAINVLEKAAQNDDSDVVRSRAKDALGKLREKQARDAGGGSTVRKRTPKEADAEDPDDMDPAISRTHTPKEAPRRRPDARAYIVVNAASNKTKAGGKHLGAKLKEHLIDGLEDEDELTLDAEAGKKLRRFTVDGAITRLERSQRGVWVELYCG
jgi:HEAT repeat protein